MQILIKNMPKTQDKDRQNCSEFFDLLCGLIDLSEDWAENKDKN